MIANRAPLLLILASALAVAACSKPAPQSQAAPPMQVADQSSATGAPSPQHGMVMTTTIAVTNTGSTNTVGYRILIGANGEASYVSGDGAGKATLPQGMFAKLKGDIDAAKPLSGLPREVSCVKPMSFGTSTFVAMDGDTTPDLECPGNDAESALKDDVAAIVAFLKLRNTPRSEGKELTPQNL
jgi:hypothetical protein